MIKFTLTISLLIISIVTSAQVEKIETDRPGKTNTPATTPKKKWQLETGFLRQKEKFYPTSSDYFFLHPSLLTKYGLGDRIELRLITDLATIKEENANMNTINRGIHNVQLGGKVNFIKGGGLKPKVSFIAHYTFNRLRTMYKDTIDGANFRFAMQHIIAENISIGYNIGMEWRRFGLAPAYIYTFSPKFNLGDKWAAFVEVYGYIWKNQKPENSIDGGVMYYVNDNFKLDVSAGFGLNKNAPDNFFTIGASCRF